MRATLVGLALLALAAPAAAQEPTLDTRWSPWLGCWELVTEDFRRDARPGVPLQQLADGRPRICVTPSEGGARFETTVSDKPAVAYTIVPNGTDRALNEPDCRGTQTAEWSRDGLRIFSRAELTCSGDKTPRRVSSLTMLAPNGHWLDVQAVALEGRESVRVRRYRRVATAGDARIVAASRLTLDDIKEATGKISTLAIEAALIETNTGFDLTSRRLIELDDAGVAESVIDLLVALSYPDRFVVERTERHTIGTPYINDPYAIGAAYWHPMFYDDFYYSPYAYRGYGGFGATGGFGDVFLVPVGGRGSVEPQPSGSGRVVDGLGYTRVRERSPEAAVTSSGRSTSSTSGGGDGGSSSSGGGSSTSSSGSSGSSGGTSSGGSSSGGDSGGRTAQPR